MGDSQGAGGTGPPADYRPGWYADDPRSSGPLRRFLDGGKATRFALKNPAPSPGTRFGCLAFIGEERNRAGRLWRVQCDCGAPTHLATPSNLCRGKSTRCPACAQHQTHTAKKAFFKYAAFIPDNEHRRRLLNRLSAAIGRCHCPTNAAYPNYGGRGIHVFQLWRDDRSEFCKHIVTLPGWYNPDLEMDRRDVNRGYEPGNVRFVTKAVNQGNRRSVRVLQQRIADLEARVRHCECGAAQSVHDCD